MFQFSPVCAVGVRVAGLRAPGWPHICHPPALLQSPECWDHKCALPWPASHLFVGKCWVCREGLGNLCDRLSLLQSFRWTPESCRIGSTRQEHALRLLAWEFSPSTNATVLTQMSQDKSQLCENSMRIWKKPTWPFKLRNDPTTHCSLKWLYCHLMITASSRVLMPQNFTTSQYS